MPRTVLPPAAPPRRPAPANAFSSPVPPRVSFSPSRRLACASLAYLARGPKAHHWARAAGRSLNAQCFQLPGGIAGARRDARREGAVKCREVAGSERHADCADILLEPPHLPRAGDRHDVGPPRQQPGERHLRLGAALLGSDALDGCEQRPVTLEIAFLEAGMRMAAILGIEIAAARQRAGEEAASERRVSDEADAELSDRRQDLL